MMSIILRATVGNPPTEMTVDEDYKVVTESPMRANLQAELEYRIALSDNPADGDPIVAFRDWLLSIGAAITQDIDEPDEVF